jgi:hypothetical protein
MLRSRGSSADTTLRSESVCPSDSSHWMQQVGMFSVRHAYTEAKQVSSLLCSPTYLSEVDHTQCGLDDHEADQNLPGSDKGYDAQETQTPIKCYRADQNTILLAPIGSRACLPLSQSSASTETAEEGLVFQSYRLYQQYNKIKNAGISLSSPRLVRYSYSPIDPCYFIRSYIRLARRFISISDY